MKTLALAALGILISLNSKIEGATLLGAQLEAEYRFPDVNSSWFPTTSFTAGSGLDVFGYMNNPSFDIDVEAGSIAISGFDNYAEHPGQATFSDAGVTFNGLIIRDVSGSAPEITGVVVNGVTNLPGFDNSRIAFSADEVRLNFQGLFYDANTIVTVDVTTIPEPSVALLGCFALGVVFLRSR